MMENAPVMVRVIKTDWLLYYILYVHITLIGHEIKSLVS